MLRAEAVDKKIADISIPILVLLSWYGCNEGSKKVITNKYLTTSANPANKVKRVCALQFNKYFNPLKKSKSDKKEMKWWPLTYLNSSTIKNWPPLDADIVRKVKVIILIENRIIL